MLIASATKIGFVPFVVLGTVMGMLLAPTAYFWRYFSRSRSAAEIDYGPGESRNFRILVTIALCGGLACFGSFAVLLPFSPWPQPWPEFDGSNSPPNQDCSFHDSDPISNGGTLVAQVRLSDCSDEWMGLVQYFVFVRSEAESDSSSNIVFRFRVPRQNVDPADLYPKGDRPNVQWVAENLLYISVTNEEYIVDARPSIGDVQIKYNVKDTEPVTGE